jgi:hypothetical protein
LPIAEVVPEVPLGVFVGVLVLVVVVPHPATHKATTTVDEANTVRIFLLFDTVAPPSKKTF